MAANLKRVLWDSSEFIIFFLPQILPNSTDGVNWTNSNCHSGFTRPRASEPDVLVWTLNVMQGQGGRKPGSTDRLNMHLLLTVPPAVRIQNCSDHVTKWHASCVCFVVLWQWSIFSTTGEEGRRDHNRYNDHLILRVSSSAAKHKIKHIPAAEAITVNQKRCPSCEN